MDIGTAEGKEKENNGMGCSLRVREKERIARASVEQRSSVLFLLNEYSALKIFAKHLITLESITGIALSVTATLVAYYLTGDQPYWNGSMDWVILGFAVVTPMSASIGITFNRREKAVHSISQVQTIAHQMYVAHCCWKWNDNSKKNRITYSDTILIELINITDDLFRFLTLPQMSRARHRVTRVGKREAGRTADAAYDLLDNILCVRLVKLAKFTEVAKMEGLPANEASRLRQWERQLEENIHNLRKIKMYRSPQGMRAFARIFSMLIPPFYGPFYAQLARDSESLAFGIGFSIITSLALTGLLNSIVALEDPFMANITVDGIDVHEELCFLVYRQLTKTREQFFPDTPMSPKVTFSNTSMLRSTSFGVMNR